jgi:hypothetical protein
VRSQGGLVTSANFFRFLLSRLGGAATGSGNNFQCRRCGRRRSAAIATNIEAYHVLWKVMPPDPN